MIKALDSLRKKLSHQGSPTTKDQFALQSIVMSAERAEYHAENFAQISSKDVHSPTLDFELKAYMNSLKDLYSLFFLSKNVAKLSKLKEIVGAKDIPFKEELHDLFIQGFMFNASNYWGPKNGPFKIRRGEQEVDFDLQRDHELVLQEVLHAVEDSD